MKKAVKKTLIIIGVVIGGLIALFLLLYAVLAVIGCAMYGEYRDVRKYECVIADTGSGLAPQGIAYSAERELFIQTGYKPGNLSALYLVRGDEYREVAISDVEGKPLKGHAGGVAVTKDRVYISNGGNLYLYSLNALENADGGVACEAVFAVDNNAAYCFSDDKRLFVGEFYRAGNYETDESHHYETPSGEYNRAVASCYDLDETGLIICAGDGQPYPEYRISVPGLVQGFAVSGGTVMLSRSYGLVNSAIEYHSLPKVAPCDMVKVTFKNNEHAGLYHVPLYYLDGTTLFKTITAPSFTEDLTIKDGRLVVTNEASANKYFVGKLFGAHKAYSLPVYESEEE